MQCSACCLWCSQCSVCCLRCNALCTDGCGGASCVLPVCNTLCSDGRGGAISIAVLMTCCWMHHELKGGHVFKPLRGTVTKVSPATPARALSTACASSPPSPLFLHLSSPCFCRSLSCHPNAPLPSHTHARSHAHITHFLCTSALPHFRALRLAQSLGRWVLHDARGRWLGR